MRGVTQTDNKPAAYLHISTHTPHARRDFKTNFIVFSFLRFQLTRLMRGVTAVGGYATDEHVNFNSHASCEA